MLNRRHIRIKVMQALYALSKSETPDVLIEEKFLRGSINNMLDLYLVLLDLITEVHAYAEDYMVKSQNKLLATSEEKNPNKKFIDNEVLTRLAQNESFKAIIEKKKLNNWRKSDEYVNVIFEELMQSDVYENYMEAETQSFDEDRSFVIAMYREVIAPNDKLYDYLEDFCITWVDDLPVVNTTLVKRLQKLKPGSPESTILPKLYKDEEDEAYARNLLRRTEANDKMLEEELEGNTPNWEQDRIANLDKVLLKMAICEFLKFPSIPIKVTINEYLELAKEYSTPKSSIFINGVLDKLVKKYQAEGRLKKAGRGLIE